MPVTNLEPKMSSNEALIQKICHVQKDLKEVKESLHDLSKAFTKFAVLEERYITITRSLSDVEKVQTELGKEFEKRITELESEQAKMVAMVQGFSIAAKAMWAVFGASIVTGITYIIKLA